MKTIMMSKYHIYIIRDYVWKDGSIGKIGATEDIQRRAKSYKLESLEILEYPAVKRTPVKIKIFTKKSISIL